MRARTRFERADTSSARAAPPRSGPLAVEQILRLQRTVGNAATARLIRFSRVDKRGKSSPRGGYRQSEDFAYLVQPGKAWMWVHDGADPPRMCQRTEELLDRRDPRGRTYRKWVPTMGFLRDCLHTAEEVIHGRQLALGWVAEADAMEEHDLSGVYSKVRDTKTLFGVGEDENIAAAVEVAKRSKTGPKPVNALADPAVGQAFVMVDRKPPPDAVAYPYHAAGVIARDGRDTVTLEMFARERVDATQEERGQQLPEFQMYGPEQTFHATWKGYYQDPVTFVIEAR